MRRWAVVSPVLCLAIAGVFVSWGSTPAVAAVQATVGLSASTVAPGASVTITAAFSVDATGELPGSVGIDVRRLGIGMGAVDYYQSTISPELFGCTIGRAADGVQLICGWSNPSPGQSASITLALAASTDAVGQWAVDTVEAPRSGGAPSSAGASISFVVAASPTGSMPQRGVNSTLSLGASTIDTGDTVTIAADFTLDPVGLRPFVVGIEVRRRTGGTGSVDHVQSVISPELLGCTIGRADGGVQYICLWNTSPGQRASITLVLAASADAQGQWDVSSVQSSSTSGGALSPAGASAFFVVGAGASTTTPPSSDSSSTSPALSVAAPSGELPNTGVGDTSTVVSLGIGLMGAGGLLIALTRRGERRA